MDHEARQSWSLPLTGGSRVDFRSDAIGVEIVGIEEGESPRLELHGDGADRIAISVREDGDTVRIRAETRGRFGWGGWDEARAVLFVPRTVTLRVHTDAGSVDLGGLGPCELEVEAAAGRIHLADVHGNLRLSTDAGQIAGRRLSGRFDVKTDAGAVRLGIDRLDVGEHRVRADVGSIHLDLAPDLPVRIDLRVAHGSVDSRFRSQPDAQAVLKVSTDVGSVRIRPASGGDARDAREDSEDRVRVEVRGIRRGPVPPIPPIPPIPPMPHFPSFFGRDPDDDEHVPDRQDEARAPERRPVDAEVERILGLVEKGELSATDADVLLRALEHE